jgi:hypothetical protein
VTEFSPNSCFLFWGKYLVCGGSDNETQITTVITRMSAKVRNADVRRRVDRRNYM